jgi:hypothetical protein
MAGLLLKKHGRPAGGPALTREADGSCEDGEGEFEVGPPLWQWQAGTPDGDCLH